jgi:hypothetical protein
MEGRYSGLRQFTDRAGLTTSTLLRELVRGAVHYRRLEVHDPEVGLPIGWVWFEDSDIDTEAYWGQGPNPFTGLVLKRQREP